MNINLFIANADGSLNDKRKLIKSAFNKASEAANKTIGADDIDVIFLDAPNNVIKELGVGGYTASSHLIYVSINPKFPIKEISLLSCLLHEMHHTVRWRKPGFGKTLKEVLITEGLATLFEEEITGKTPIYAKVKYDEKCVELANKEFDNSKFNYYDWFVGGDKEKGISRWFGYSYGYQLAKRQKKT